MQYIGEHLLPGKLGHFFVLLVFATSFVATIAFFKSAQSKQPEEKDSWLRMAKLTYGLNTLAIFCVFFTIYYILRTHLFEYNFAWEHSSKSLEFKYLLACIWEAQEGSFLLWMIWHGVLGIVLMTRSARQWVAPVMTVLSGIQLVLATMIMGVFIFHLRLGHSPFLLVRQMDGLMDQPLFNRADYLSFPQMQDGQSLNSLLQNYWMVIHPPVLFLGFASTVVPFAYCIAGLWTKQFGAWVKPALPWTLFSACVLGTGIMMGAAWAYESLTFGGYWAWDPVENASLVPWLVMVAGLHTMVVYNATGHSLRASYIMVMTAFILVLYSTYLTRSGRLGDTSVHAFVDSGMDWQLLSLIGVFLLPGMFLLGRYYKQIPHIQKEESASSREFWMFLGSLILFLSAGFIITATSLPIFNLLFGTKWTTGEDAAFTYNRIEIFVAVLLGGLTAFSQYLKYKETKRAYLVKKMAVPTLVALLGSAAISIWGGIHYDKYGPGYLAAIHLALFAAVYSVAANAGYIWAGLGGKLKAAGASVAHVGFGLALLGILISSAKKEVLSINTTGINVPLPAEMKENPLENITLLQHVRTDMGKYWATYLRNDSLNASGNTMFFQVNFKDKKSGESFDLYPNLIKNSKGQEGYSHNPDKYHYWDRDIFTYLNYANVMDAERDTTRFTPHQVALKDTVFYSRGYMILEKIVPNPDNDKYHFSNTDTALMAEVKVMGNDSITYTARPALFVKNNEAHYLPDTVFAQNLAVSLGRITDHQKIELLVKESSNMVPFISLKVYLFPQINLLWLGIIIMVVGFIMSIAQRLRARPKAVQA